MPRIRDAGKDIKDMMIAGCRVQLAFDKTENGQWRIKGTVTCGIEDQAAEQPFSTTSYPTRDKAEEEALRQAADILGNNVGIHIDRIIS
jgi:hypothetical protein